MPIAIGSAVLIKRGHLWAGCVGTVVKQVEETRKKGGPLMKWRIRIPMKAPTKYNDCYHTDAAPEFLEELTEVWEIEPVKV